ncbi:hypothetical protein DI272_18815 [Streptomyces sp. Act143]|uniref:hypothetical protein n=1 Tax=Streptomyces sp. Act143 TaxID=2200760 RepID=UPI000D679ED0|nr:hypothetical protein [Streptomyces sp. Act143]PWI15986.1 hypothetical protein DI272_18815 [Streptomyces sp. Act143]
MRPWTIRPIRLPDHHLPHGLDSGQPACRPCNTAWPCGPAREHLSESRCTCGAAVWRDKTTPRKWHVGPLCYTPADVTRWQAAELKEARQPHYPPSHFYPPKPPRPVRQRPPYRHTPAGPGDVNLGTWVWVAPGALHAGWGDIHHLAMITALGLPRCEVWLILDGTVHLARADLLVLTGNSSRRGETPPAWTGWTVAEHLVHGKPATAPVAEPVQDGLFGL